MYSSSVVSNLGYAYAQAQVPLLRGKNPVMAVAWQLPLDLPTATIAISVLAPPYPSYLATNDAIFSAHLYNGKHDTVQPRWGYLLFGPERCAHTVHFLSVEQPHYSVKRRILLSPVLGSLDSFSCYHSLANCIGDGLVKAVPNRSTMTVQSK